MPGKKAELPGAIPLRKEHTMSAFVANSKRLTLAGARKMMDAAIGQAEAAGYAIAVAIVEECTV